MPRYTDDDPGELLGDPNEVKWSDPPMPRAHFNRYDAFVPEVGWYEEQQPADEREVPVPFDQLCPDCGQYKEPDNYLCDPCWERNMDRERDHQ
jgi:hypothetical protein